MGSWRKVGAFLGLVPEDQRPYDDDGGYEGEYEGSYDRDYGSFDGPAYADHDRPARSAYAAAVPADQYPARTERRSEPITHGALAVAHAEAVRRDPDGAARPATVKLTGFAEARVIGEKYRDGQSVILDMTDMSDADARRLVDFSAGLAFSLRGSIEKVAPKVFMLLPADSDVAALTAAASSGR
ncbi:cell division protein SepF [Nakamurella endophytica]|uniref:Cell division protein SepF n=1 Tax=Nakamurella endophytica TaxID=1748367 RepID=A0A917T6Y2_9ACTN|nr:cell division protein SepF [Nakamurella endophytica]GGM11629.1 cell division protein SepF [Nakamurella endophytica]